MSNMAVCAVLWLLAIQEACHGGIDGTVSISSVQCRLARYCPACLKTERNQARDRVAAARPGRAPVQSGCAVQRSRRQIFQPRSDFRIVRRTPTRAAMHIDSHSAYASRTGAAASPPGARDQQDSRAIAPGGLTKSATVA